MKGLFARNAYTGFGPASLGPSTEPPILFAVESKRPSRLRDKVRRQCPQRPGVYGMVDPGGELIYVGKAKNLRSRLLCYFRKDSRDPKAGRILESSRLVAWEHSADEFGALLRELELIRRWRPRFNVQGQPQRRRRCYVCLGRRPAPYGFLTARPPANAAAVYGPVPAGPKSREAVRRLNDWYKLRDCPQAVPLAFAGEGELFPLVRAPGCIRHEIGHCLAPCAASCTRGDYAAGVRAARGFLEGSDHTPVEVLQREMDAASAALAYERAGALRDKLEPLRWLGEHLDRLRMAGRQSFVYPVTGEDGDTLWYLVHRGRVRAVVPAPIDDSGRRSAAVALSAVYDGGAEVGGPLSLDEIDGVLLVAAWFRKHRAERDRTLEPTAALPFG